MPTSNLQPPKRYSGVNGILLKGDTPQLLILVSVPFLQVFIPHLSSLDICKRLPSVSSLHHPQHVWIAIRRIFLTHTGIIRYNVPCTHLQIFNSFWMSQNEIQFLSRHVRTLRCGTSCLYTSFLSSPIHPSSPHISENPALEICIQHVHIFVMMFFVMMFFLICPSIFLLHTIMST